ncbi:MAG: PQQ-binding-like beta-propeller repeat protein, partial [Acidobacteriaceae bacterium]|nr:PQQ-binding-like beta-propeller repeat protein [Acidobacteriaceae bacterium]
MQSFLIVVRALACVATATLLGTICHADTDLPNGKGRDEVIRMCVGCHPIDIVTATRLSKPGWKKKVDDMVGRGAKGTPDEIATVVDYLSAHFGAEPNETESSTGSPKSNRNSQEYAAGADAHHASDVPQQSPRELAPYPNWRLPVDTQWPTYDNDPGGTKYSTLTQITAGNVTKLKRAWTYASGDKGFTFEVTPIVINGVMYLSTSTEKAVALNADTGQEIWRFDPQVARAREHRGVSYWPGDGDNGARVILATSDGRLFALDAKTGKPCNDFGDNGVVNLKTGV